MYNFSFVGKIREIKSDKLKGFEEMDYASGWKARTLRFNVVSNHNSIMVQSKALYQVGKDVRSFRYNAGEKKTTRCYIPWADRNKKSVIDSVAPFSRLVIDLNPEKGQYSRAKEATKAILEEQVSESLLKAWKVESSKELIEKIKEIESRHFEFISEYDFIEKLKEIIRDPAYSNAEFYISGTSDTSYSEQNERFYDSNIVKRVALAPESATEKNQGTVTLYYGADSLVQKDDKWIVSGYHDYYDQAQRSKCFAPFELVILPKTGDDDVSKKTNDIIKKWFSKPRDNEIMEIGVNFDFINSAQREDLKIEDLPEETQELLALGLISEAEIRKENGKAFGERVKELRFNSLSRGYSRGPKETKFLKKDMIRQEKSKDTMTDDIWNDLM